ncbi:MAG: sugar phosphate isomerase/epimerase [bacterium]|nr:sugar phosphate isomerase/epimerase [bacterium]
MAKSRIGCNLVDVVSDDGAGFYTLAAYRNVLNDYVRYRELIGALEFSHVTNITPEEAVTVGNWARELGFETWSIHSEHLNVGDRLEDYLAVQKHEAEVCAALGCKVMVCHLPNLRPYVDFERDLDVIGKVAELTHANGVRLAVETCLYPDAEGALQPDADLVIKIVETLNMDDVGVNVDTGHNLIGQSHAREAELERILSGEEKQTLPDLVRRIGKKLFTTHLQDNFGMNDDHQAPGFGYIDWGKLVPAILATGYQGPLMMELTGKSVKLRRTVPQLRDYPLEKEIVFSASYLNFLLKQNEQKQ